MANKRAWKFLHLTEDGQIKSDHGDLTWIIGEWQHVGGTVYCCSNGLHCSDRISEALGYVQGAVLACVEVKGKSDHGTGKSAWSDMRIVKAYCWTKEDSVAFAIHAAEMVIGIFEKARPDDDRPRKAIEAAKKYLAVPGAPAANAAADAANAAADAAANAAADAAADAANAAANAAADAAADAANAAANAADAAADGSEWRKAREELFGKIERWMENRLSKLEVIGQA